jgi:hypothetical protein
MLMQQLLERLLGLLLAQMFKPMTQNLLLLQDLLQQQIAFHTLQVQVLHH